jgi:hypothetical protein
LAILHRQLRRLLTGASPPRVCGDSRASPVWARSRWSRAPAARGDEPNFAAIDALLPITASANFPTHPDPRFYGLLKTSRRTAVSARRLLALAGREYGARADRAQAQATAGTQFDPSVVAVFCTLGLHDEAPAERSFAPVEAV